MDKDITFFGFLLFVFVGFWFIMWFCDTMEKDRRGFSPTIINFPARRTLLKFLSIIATLVSLALGIGVAINLNLFWILGISAAVVFLIAFLFIFNPVMIFIYIYRAYFKLLDKALPNYTKKGY